MRAVWLWSSEKTAAPMKVKPRLTQYTPGWCGSPAVNGISTRHRRAERRDLRQRQVDEDHAALDDVHAEVGVDAGEDQAGGKRRRQELQDGRIHALFHARFLNVWTSRLTL